MKKNRVIGVLLARTGSNRLKNKVLLKINQKKTILEFLIDRIKDCKNLDEIILATSNKNKDKKILTLAKKKNIKCFCGDEKDVLKRICDATKVFSDKYNYIVRINCDCPFVMPHILDRDIKNFINSNGDIYSPFYKNSIPLGFSSVIFKKNTLYKINKLAKKLKYREHIENYCFDNPNKFRIIKFKKNKKLNFPKLSFLLDNKKDFLKLKEAYNLINNVSYKNQPIKLIKRFSK